MSDDPDTLIMGYLSQIDTKTDRMAEDVSDIKHRVTSMETTVAGIQDGIFGIRCDHAVMQVSLDRTDTRLDRIEQRKPTPSAG